MIRKLSILVISMAALAPAFAMDAARSEAKQVIAATGDMLGNITDAISDMPDIDVSGDWQEQSGQWDENIQSIAAIQQYLAGVKTVVDGFDTVVEHSGMSAEEIAVEGVNAKYDAYISYLEASGVAIDKTALEQARSIEITTAMHGSLQAVNASISERCFLNSR